MRRSKVKLEYVCQSCREDLPSDTRLSPRSLVWAYGIPGVRYVFCSPECRDKHDAEARAGRKGGDDETEE